MTNALNLQAPVDTLAMDFTREFDAPVEAVFRAHAEPDLVKQWLGPHGMEMDIERLGLPDRRRLPLHARERARQVLFQRCVPQSA